MEALSKYDHLKNIIAEFRSVIIAYSGGLDSAFLLYAAVAVLGRENVHAITADSPSYPRREMEQARQFAAALGLGERHRVVETKEISNPDYAANSAERCFFCKQELYTRLTELALFEQVEVVLDGFNADDAGDFRPGRRAAEKFSIRSPLFEADLHKEEIRSLARHFGLEIWNKPQMACLASRIPYGSPVTPEKLAQIEKAEDFLHSLGFTQVRVRHHGQIARLELARADLKRIMKENLEDTINAKLRALGFLWVAADLGGFRSGSLNQALERNDRDV